MSAKTEETILCSSCATRDEDGNIITKGRHATSAQARACKGVPNPDAVRMIKWVLNTLSKKHTPEVAFAIAAQTLAEIGAQKFVEVE